MDRYIVIGDSEQINGIPDTALTKAALQEPKGKVILGCNLICFVYVSSDIQNDKNNTM
jgi:hypothetical protein